MKINLQEFLNMHSFVTIEDYTTYGRNALPAGSVVEVLSYSNSMARVKTVDNMEWNIPLRIISQPLPKIVKVNKTKKLTITSVNTHLEVRQENINFGNLPKMVGDVNYASFFSDADLPSLLLISFTKTDRGNLVEIDGSLFVESREVEAFCRLHYNTTELNLYLRGRANRGQETLFIFSHQN